MCVCVCLRNPEQDALWDPVHVEFNLYIFFKSGPPVKDGFKLLMHILHPLLLFRQDTVN